MNKAPRLESSSCPGRSAARSACEAVRCVRGSDWIASSQELLAMTEENTELRSFRAIASEAKQSMVQQTRVRRNGLLRRNCSSQ
jgi:hypothetical protein